jgi:succinate dehydrogenase / fumarate reductase membrane anchor subunit
MAVRDVRDVERRPATPRREQPLLRPRQNFETWSWFFMRISGIVLLFLVLIHLYIMHLTGGGVERVGFDFVAARWATVGWRSFDWIMLVLALLHGANGLRIVIEDYVRSPGLRTAVKGALYALTVVLMIMGTAVIVTFDPVLGG